MIREQTLNPIAFEPLSPLPSWLDPKPTLEHEHTWVPDVNQPWDYDVVIVGAGIVGATLALALRRSGLSIALVESRPIPQHLHDGRAYHVSMLSGQILHGLGVWDAISSQATTFHQIHLSDANYPSVVQFNPQDLGSEPGVNAVGYVATHGVLLKALYDELHRQGGITWQCPATVTHVDYGTDEQAKIATVYVTRPPQSDPSGIAESTSPVNGCPEPQKEQWRCRLVVAADGAKSPIRQGAGIGTRGWQYWQSCITCKIRPENPDQTIAYERFQPGGPFAILPLPDNSCQIVWTAPHAEARAFAALDDSTFLQELTKRYGEHMGRLSLASDRYVFPVQLMQSDLYTAHRLALVGDAAHSCHPVGGQGLNMGIRDAAALADVLTAAHHQGEDLGCITVLRRYESWRKYENLAILGFTDLLDRVFSTTWWPIVLVRRLGLHGLQTLKPFKSFALRLMTGLTGRRPSLTQP